MSDFDPDRIQKFVEDWVVRNSHALAVLNDSLFYFGELGMQEFRTVELMTSLLREHGFTVKTGLSGFPTGFMATYGSGAPVIAIHSEYDALPFSSQKSGVPRKEAIVEGAPGHAEGHNCNGAVLTASGIAMRYAMEKFAIPGVVKIFGAPAEEQTIARPYFVRDGHFDDVDIALHPHLHSTFKTEYGLIQSANIAATFTFHGVSAHAGAYPWRGRDALDAVVLMDVGIAQFREHFEPGMIAHRIISNGGDQPNIIPSEAAAYWFFRGPSADTARSLFEAGQRIARGAAMMTQTEVSIESLTAVWPTRCNRTVAEVLQRNIERIGMPLWTEEEHAFAKAVQRENKAPEAGLETSTTPLRGMAKQSGSSNDGGDISWNVPMGRLWFPSNIPNAPAHHWSAGAALATSIAHRGNEAGTRVIALTALDFLTNPQLVMEAKSTFQKEVGDVQYSSLLPDDARPPITMNADLMERWRSSMEAHYVEEAPVFVR